MTTIGGIRLTKQRKPLGNNGAGIHTRGTCDPPSEPEGRAAQVAAMAADLQQLTETTGILAEIIKAGLVHHLMDGVKIELDAAAVAPEAPGGQWPPHPLYEALARVPDHRTYRAAYPLPAVLSLCVSATLCGARDIFAVADWGSRLHPNSAQQIGFQGGLTPQVSTLNKALDGLDVLAFEAILTHWIGRAIRKDWFPPDPSALDHNQTKVISANEQMRQKIFDAIYTRPAERATLRYASGQPLPGLNLVNIFAQWLGLAQMPPGSKGKVPLIGAKDLLAALDKNGIVLTGAQVSL